MAGFSTGLTGSDAITSLREGRRELRTGLGKIRYAPLNCPSLESATHISPIIFAAVAVPRYAISSEAIPF